MVINMMQNDNCLFCLKWYFLIFFRWSRHVTVRKMSWFWRWTISTRGISAQSRRSWIKNAEIHCYSDTWIMYRLTRLSCLQGWKGPVWLLLHSNGGAEGVSLFISGCGWSQGCSLCFLILCCGLFHSYNNYGIIHLYKYFFSSSFLLILLVCMELNW